MRYPPTLTKRRGLLGGVVRGYVETWRDAPGRDATLRLQVRERIALEDPGGVLSGRVVKIEYEHVEDEWNEIRVHDFREGVELVALPGGSAVLLYRPDGKRIWRDF